MLVRGAALKTVLVQHENVVQALSEYAEASRGETTSKARGLLKQITAGKFVLMILLSLPAINLLENINQAVQSRSFAISGAVAAMEVTYKVLERKELFMEYLPPVSSDVKSCVLRLLNYLVFVAGQRRMKLDRV